MMLVVSFEVLMVAHILLLYAVLYYIWNIGKRVSSTEVVLASVALLVYGEGVP
jgi:hypothetical protein